MSEFVVPIRVQEEQDLYAGLDPSGISLGADLTAYLSDLVVDRRIGETVRIEIHSATVLDMERFQKAYLLFIEKLRSRNRREIAKNKANALRLLLIGVAFIVIGIAFATRLNQVLAAIISTIGSFSVWEASAVWIETLPTLRAKDRLLKMFREAGIRFIGEGEEETTTPLLAE